MAKDNAVKLTLVQRFLILDLLSANRGDYKTMVITKDLTKKIEVTQKEIEKFEVKFEGSLMKWNKKKTPENFTYAFTELEMNEVKLCLKKQNDNKNLTMQSMELIDAFGVKID